MSSRDSKSAMNSPRSIVEGGGSLMVAWQLKRKNVLVVGGGEVAASRINHLLVASAQISVICPTLGLARQTSALLAAHPEHITHIARDFQPSDLEEPFIPALVCVAISSTPLTYSDDVDPSTVIPSSSEIYRLCHSSRIPVNVADVPSECDFYFGSVIRRGDVQVCVSTNGKGPRVARLLREKIEGVLPVETEEAVKKVGKLRELLRMREPGMEKESVEKRMKWITEISDLYTLRELSQLEKGDMETLLDCYERDETPRFENLRVERYRDENAGWHGAWDGAWGFFVGWG